MATTQWTVINKAWCVRLNREADLLEERAYPDDVLNIGGETYQVLGHKCSLGIVCNLSGFACRWAGTNPNYDPFVEA